MSLLLSATDTATAASERFLGLQKTRLRQSTFSVSPNGTETKDRKSENFLSERETSQGYAEGWERAVHTHSSPFGLVQALLSAESLLKQGFV